MTPEEFGAIAHVSRETLERLRRYIDLLSKWRRAINLVAADSVQDLWRRHILDSSQIKPLLPETTTHLADIGSGAGFPGLVLAVLGVPRVHLIESDSRKCVFLAEAARAAGLDLEQSLKIHNRRVEQIKDIAADVVTARACADLDRLLTYAVPLLKPSSTCVFLKGAKVEEELTAASRNWHMDVERFASVSSSSGVILRIRQPARRY